jgi:hypothetical protein
MANKSHDTRSNVTIKRGTLPSQRPKIVDDKALEKLTRKAEEAGLVILHGKGKPKKKGGQR